jgi:hypothetical protein
VSVPWTEQGGLRRIGHDLAMGTAGHKGKYKWAFIAACLLLAIVYSLLDNTFGYFTDKTLDRVVPAVTGKNTPGTTPAPTATKSADPLANQAALGSYEACGPEAIVSRPLPKAEICVIYWCKGEVFSTTGRLSRTSLQIKLRPKITNNSDHALDVRVGQPSSILLLVSDKDARRRWEPPPLTERSGLRPRLLQVNGNSYWAIPPNVNGDATSAGNGYYTGFMSTWYESSIAPGSSFLETGKNGDGSLVHRNNLVFQLPMDKDGNIHPVAVVLVDRRTGAVLALQSFDHWGRPSEPQSF